MELPENINPLDTQGMADILKGDQFPETGAGFLGEDVRAFFDTILDEKKLRKSEVIRKANINRIYAYQIMTGRRLGKRDYYLRLALAMGIDLRTTQRLLAITQRGALHPLIKRDAAVIFALNHGYDPDKTYFFMCELDLTPLETGLEDI